MQLARTPVVVETISRVRLLLSFHDDRSRAQRVHRPARHVNHFAGVDVNPVQQFLGTFFLESTAQIARE